MTVDRLQTNYEATVTVNDQPAKTLLRATTAADKYRLTVAEQKSFSVQPLLLKH